MPSRYSSDHSTTDADALCRGHSASSCARSPSSRPSPPSSRCSAPSFEGLAEDLTEENLQPRIRGTLLMALSNKFRGWLVLTTGNKSELAVGYSTLYGDTAGGFAVIKDVPKLLVYELCRLRNERAGARGHPRGRCSPSRRRPSCAPTSATTSRCRPTRCSTRSSRPTSRTTSPAASSSSRASTRRSSSGSPGWSTSPSTSAGRTRPARASPQGLRQGPPHADHERLPRMTDAPADHHGPVRLRRRAHVVAVGRAGRGRRRRTSSCSSAPTRRTPTTRGTRSSGARWPSPTGSSRSRETRQGSRASRSTSRRCRRCSAT